MSYIESYRQCVLDLLDRINTSQTQAIAEAADLAAGSLLEDGVLHVFSTGHSHMIVEEMFYRTGGLVPVNPVFDSGTMLHEGALRSTRLERLPGYAGVIFRDLDVREGEPMLIASNSGINPVPVEMAQLAKEAGMNVICITSKDISKHLKPRHATGMKLMNIADVVIDNCIVENDAAVELSGTGQRVGALSSIAGMYIANCLVVEIAARFTEAGVVPPVLMSSNMPEGDGFNSALLKKYGRRIKGF
ncbi:MAG TPA: SIS domain-containing protein [Bacillota bacterium]|nr:SIS domain-containing protein [Bacillota bacterium]